MPTIWFRIWPKFPSTKPKPNGIPLSIVENRVDCARGKNTGQQRADRPACAMHAEGIQRIVVAEPSS